MTILCCAQLLRKVIGVLEHTDRLQRVGKRTPQPLGYFNSKKQMKDSGVLSSAPLEVNDLLGNPTLPDRMDGLSEVGRQLTDVRSPLH